MFEECCTLQDCEKLLAEELQHAELIGEVTISQEGLDGLIDFVDSEEFRFRDHPEEALARFPHVMAVLLVWIGVYDYEAGAYWPGVPRRLAIAQDAQSRAYLGGRFLAQLSLWGKPTFADIRGHVYVARILAHGGIPDTCLSDFFQHILLPVLRGRVSGVPVDPYDPDGVVQALDARYDSLTAVVDKPVLRFLLHGGPAARDFLLRCVDMAYTIVHSDELSSGAKFGLPPRVVTAFREWLNEENHERSPRSDAHRWRRPRITLNLQRRTIDLRLPEQWLPCEIFNHVSLVISHRGKHLRSERLPLFRQSGQVYSDEIAVTLPPSDEYTATIVLARHNSADNELRTWPRLEGMRSAKAGDSDEAPGGHSHWLVFDSDRLEVIRDDYLSKEELWLVAPADSSVPSIAEPHPLTGRWAEYAAFPVLPEGNTFEFELPDGSIVAIPVAKSARPRLEGEQVREVSCCGDPVYRAPPVLKLPDSSWGSRHLILRALAGQRLSPGRWPIEELQSARTDGGTLLIDLGAAGLLGDVRVGYYSLRIEGPLGEDFTCRFAIVRDITIQFEKPLYCPDAPEEPTRMRIGAQEGILVTEEGIEKADKAMTKASGRYNTRLQVSLVNGNEAETYEPVSLSCVPPRVRLHLAQDADSVPEVSTAPFTVGIQELRDNDLEMVVILPHVEGGVAELEFAGRTERTTIVGQQAAFRLGAFLEAIACASSDVVRGEVTVSGGTLAYPICFPVMTVEKSWSIASPRCTLARKRGMERWYIRWHQSAAPENRVLRLWNTWRPWEMPVRLPLPSGARSCECNPSELHLVAAEYLLEPLVADDWVQQAPPVAAPVGTRGAERCRLGRAEERLRRIASSRKLDEAIEYSFAEAQAQHGRGPRPSEIDVQGLVIRDRDDARALLYSMAHVLVHGAMSIELRNLRQVCEASNAAQILRDAHQELSEAVQGRNRMDEALHWDCAVEAAGVLCGAVEPNWPARQGSAVEYVDPEDGMHYRGVLEELETGRGCPQVHILFTECQTNEGIEPLTDCEPYPVLPTRWHLITPV